MEATMGWCVVRAF